MYITQTPCKAHAQPEQTNGRQWLPEHEVTRDIQIDGDIGPLQLDGINSCYVGLI